MNGAYNPAEVKPIEARVGIPDLKKPLDGIVVNIRKVVYGNGGFTKYFLTQKGKWQKVDAGAEIPPECYLPSFCHKIEAEIKEGYQ